MAAVEIVVQFGQKQVPIRVQCADRVVIFKRRLADLARLEPVRIKVFARGSGGWRGTLGDAGTVGDLGLRDGQVVMVSGSAKKASKAFNARNPKKKPWTWATAGVAIAAAACVWGAASGRGGRGASLTTMWFGAMSAVTFVAWGWDKLAAKAENRRRTPERTLLSLSALGGWPGGTAGILFFHHKSIKAQFLIRFGAAIVVNVAGSAVLYKAGVIGLPFGH